MMGGVDGAAARYNRPFPPGTPPPPGVSMHSLPPPSQHPGNTCLFVDVYVMVLDK